MRTLDIDKLNIPKEIKEQYKHWDGATVHISKTRLQKLCKNNLSKLKEYNFITKYYYKMGDGQDLNFHNGLYIRVATIDELDMLERPYVDWE